MGATRAVLGDRSCAGRRPAPGRPRRSWRPRCGPSSSTSCSPEPTRPTAAAASSRPVSRRCCTSRTCRRRAAIEPVDGGVRVERLSDRGHDVLEAALPALVVGTQLLGEPRYPSLRGIMGARSKEIAVRTLADIGLAGDPVGGAAASTAMRGGPRARRRVARGACSATPDPAAAAAAIVDFLVERRAL